MNHVKQSNKPRVAWFAGTRGELLHLGPVFKALATPQAQQADASLPRTQWLMNTGEQGTALQQALDWLGLEADETAELCHPGDEPANRLQQLLARVEGFARLRRADRLICAGHGPTAAACALTAASRGNRVLWLRPADPAGVVPRLAWEACLTRVIEACGPAVETLPFAALPDWSRGATTMRTAGGRGRDGEGGSEAALDEALYGLRAGAQRVVIAVQRREWGLRCGGTDQLARALGAAATARPEVDWVVAGTLNARLEEPLRALNPAPANLRVLPPLPADAWGALRAGASAVLTDSPSIAAEALATECALATLGDAGDVAARGADLEAKRGAVQAIGLDQLTTETLLALQEAGAGLDAARGARREPAAFDWEPVLRRVREFLSA